MEDTWLDHVGRAWPGPGGFGQAIGAEVSGPAEGHRTGRGVGVAGRPRPGEGAHLATGGGGGRRAIHVV